jgi:branched-chain amino acid transport system substrate-binding protein
MDRRGVLRLFGALAAAGVAGAAAACSTTPDVGPNIALPNGKHITIGLVAPTGGAYVRAGKDITDGFKQYLTEHQGLLGLYTVDLKIVEEGTSAADATRAIKSLIDQGVLAVAGVASPASLAAMVPEAVTAKIPLMSANAAPSSIGSADFVWRVSSVLGEAGQAAANFAHAQGRRAYILSDGSSAATAEVAGFTAGFTALDGVISGSAVGTDDLSSKISNAVDAHVDVIFAAHSGDSAFALLNAYRQAGTSIKLVGPGALTETIDLTKLTALPPHVYTSMYYAPDLDNVDNQRFVAGYQITHGTPPSSVVTAAYDAAGVLDRALALLTGDPDSTKLNDAIKVLGQINSPRGTWTFNPSHTPQQTWYLRQLRFDGQVASNLHDSDLAVLS